MQYIITFLLVTGTIFQIVQSVADDPFQNTVAWLYPAFKGQIEWLKDVATGTTNNIMNLPNNMKNKLINVFTITSSVPNTGMEDGEMSGVKIVKTTITNGDGEIIQTDTKVETTTKESETDISEPSEI